MKRNEYYWGQRLCLILIFILLMCSLSIQSAAEHRDFDFEKFQDTLFIPGTSLKTVDLNFQEGEELEFIYSLEVKEGLPIDVWFVNDENYNKFVGGGEFAYFIDGSEQNVIVDTKIVGIKEYNSYKLILANYNNQTVEIDMIYEIRIYEAESSDDSTEDPLSSNLTYILIVVIIILSAFLIILIIKNRRLENIETEITEKAAFKKSKGRSKPKQKTKSMVSTKVASKKPKNRKSSSPKKHSTQKNQKKNHLDKDFGFCGDCGKPVETQYCKYCGHEV